MSDYYSITIQTSEGDIVCVPILEQALVERGLIVRENDTLRATVSKQAVFDAIDEIGVCDFCSALHPPYRYPVADFQMVEGHNSTGGWAACETCKDLIVRGQRDELSRRSLNTILKKKYGTHGTKLEVTEVTVELQKKFWDGLQGRLDQIQWAGLTLLHYLSQGEASDGEKAKQALLEKHSDPKWVAQLNMFADYSKQMAEIEIKCVEREKNIERMMADAKAKKSKPEARRVYKELKGMQRGSNRLKQEMVALTHQALLEVPQEFYRRVIDALRDVGATDSFVNGISKRIVVPAHVNPMPWTELTQRFASLSPTMAQDMITKIGLGGRGRDILTHLEKDGLVVFAESNDHQPCVFIAPEKDFRSNDERWVANKLVDYFDAQGSFDSETGTLQSMTATDPLSEEARFFVNVTHEAVASIRADGTVITDDTDPDFIRWPDAIHAELDRLVEKNGWNRKAVASFIAKLTSAHYEEINKRPAKMLFDRALDYAREAGILKTAVNDVTAADAPGGIMGRVHTPNEWTEKAGVKAGDPVFKLEERTMAQWEQCWPLAVREIAKDSKCSRHVVESVIKNWTEGKVLRFIEIAAKGEKSKVVMGILPNGWPPILTRSEKEISRSFAEKFDVAHPNFDQQLAGKAFISESGTTPGVVIFPTALKPSVPPPTGDRPGEHTYVKALETQYSCLSDVIEHLAASKRAHFNPQSPIERAVVETWSTDIELLKRAETYCWFREQIQAVEATAATLPDSVHLTRDLTMCHTGWWYLTDPLPIQTMTDYPTVMALLWGWVVIGNSPGVSMSSIVWSDGRPMPSTKLFWQEGQTLAQALKALRANYRVGYQSERPDSVYRRTSIGEDPTLAAMERMMRFFAAGSLWIKQRILVTTKAHIERHAKKRLIKERPEMPNPEIQIIQLRRRDVKGQPKSGESRHVDWSCQWVVGGLTGCWRDQYYPSKGIHQPKLILPYVKGPVDKPLKTPAHRVNVVNR